MISNCNKLKYVRNRLWELIKGVHKFKRKKVWRCTFSLLENMWGCDIFKYF